MNFTVKIIHGSKILVVFLAMDYYNSSIEKTDLYSYYNILGKKRKVKGIIYTKITDHFVSIIAILRACFI